MRISHHVYLAAAILVVATAPAVAQPSPARRGSTGAPPSGEVARQGAVLSGLLEIAQARAPGVRTAELRLAAARGDRRQAGAHPNPELSADLENVAGTGAYRGTRSFETTIGVTQLLEVNGARTARISGATAAVTVAERELEIARLDAVRDTIIAYAAFVAAARNVEVERERARLASEVVRATQDRMRAGRDPLVELRRAEVAQATARIGADRAEREVDATRRGLATVLGQGMVEAAIDHAWFEAIGPAPVPAAATMSQAPDLARLQAEIARSRATLETERANALPNPSIRGGVRYFQESRDTAAIIGLSVPIPIFDRNRGNIERAGADLARSEAEAQQATVSLAADLAGARRRLDLAWREADSIRRVVLPAAREAQGLAREGYAAGRFSLLEALDAQRTLSEARAQLNAALNEFHTRRAEAERLEGRSTTYIRGGVR
jgi:outer membrane protein, heavy metal efflux system